MNVSIYISNPTNQSVTFRWFAGIPQFDFWTHVYRMPISPGFNQTLNTSIPVGDWGATPFAIVFYVDLQDTKTLQTLTADVCYCAYSPGNEGSGEFMQKSIINISDGVFSG
jgi:hypothetical protein